MNRLNTEHTKMLAQLLCHKLALDLDAHDKSTIAIIAPILMDLPLEDVLEAIRAQITLDRIIIHCLDEDPMFDQLLRNINASLSTIFLEPVGLNTDYYPVPDPDPFKEDF